MNREKLLKLQSQVRIGGKGTPRRKKKVVHQTPNTDDKKLQSVLKKISVNLIPGIEEVNMIKNDGTVIYFNNPKTQASLATNTFAITGHSEIKSIAEMMPSILPYGKLEDVLKYTRLAEDISAGKGTADLARGILKDNINNDDDDDVPDLVADFEETANKDIERETAKLQINEPPVVKSTTTGSGTELKEEATITEIP